MPFLAWFFDDYKTALAMSWSGMLFDTLVPFGVLYGPTREVSVVLMYTFHGLNAVIFANIGLFPYVMMIITPIYFVYHWPTGVLRHIGYTTGSISTVKYNGRTLSTSKKCVLAFLSLVLLQQVLTPLHHHMYPGSVVWTEQGHLFSWRMKLRDKSGMMNVYEEVDGVTTKVPLQRWLSPKQVTKMTGKPDMLIQFAHSYADAREKHTGKRPRVRAVLIVSVNFRTPQYMVDPRVDLALEPPWAWPSSPYAWIVPLLPRNTTSHKMMPKIKFPVVKNPYNKKRISKMFAGHTLKDAMRDFSQYY